MTRQITPVSQIYHPGRAYIVGHEDASRYIFGDYPPTLPQMTGGQGGLQVELRDYDDFCARVEMLDEDFELPSHYERHWGDDYEVVSYLEYDAIDGWLMYSA